MKKLLFIALASICMGAMLTACTGKTAAAKHTELDTVWNNHIQKTFFGVSFGASQKEVIKAFSKQGLYDNSFIRTFSLSQMSRTELARVMPWRENEG